MTAQEEKKEGSRTLYLYNLFGHPYDLSLLSDRLQMRIELARLGFFKREENKKYFDWFDQTVGMGGVLELLGAIKLFVAIKIPKDLKNEN